MGYTLAHQNAIPKPKRSEALKLAQQRYRQNHRDLVNERQKLWYYNNKELFNTYKRKSRNICS